MTRPELDDLLVDYLYDELDAERSAAFEAALVAHPELVEEVAAHRATRSAMAGLHDQPLPAGLLDGVLAEAGRVAEAALAARAAAAPAAAAPPAAAGFWHKIAALFSQPAFATAAVAAVVLGVGLVALDAPDRDVPNRLQVPGGVVTQPAPGAEGEATPASAAEPEAVKGLADEVAKPKAANAGVPSEDDSVSGEAAARAQGLGLGTEGLSGAAGAAGTAEARRGDGALVVPSETRSKAAPQPVSDSKKARPRRAARTKAPATAAKKTPDAVWRTGNDGVPSAAPKTPAPVRRPSVGSSHTLDAEGDSAAIGGVERGRTEDAAEERRPEPARPASAGGDDRASSTRTGQPTEPLPEVPIAVPDQAHKDDLEGAPPAEPVTTDRAKPSAPEPSPASDKATDHRAGSGPPAREAADDDSGAAPPPAIALWERYARYVAEERWADADAILDQLDRLAGQGERVTRERRQLSERRAARHAEQTKQGVQRAKTIEKAIDAPASER